MKMDLYLYVQPEYNKELDSYVCPAGGNIRIKNSRQAKI